MHIDFAKEQLEKIHNPKYVEKPTKSQGDYNFASAYYFDKNKSNKFYDFVIEHGNELSKEIVKTILSKIDNRYYKITQKQIHVVLEDIFNKFSVEEINNNICHNYN